MEVDIFIKMLVGKISYCNNCSLACFSANRLCEGGGK